jgi:hypothetical protein
MTVETEANGTHEEHMKGVLPWWVHWAHPAGTRDFCPSLAALVGPVQNMFFFTVPYFNSFFPITQQAAWAMACIHAGSPGS